MIGPAPFLVYLFPVAFLALIVLVVAAVLRPRGEPDEHGRRPFAVYLLAVMFVSLFSVVVSVQQLASVLVDEAVGAPDLPGSFWAVSVGREPVTYTGLGPSVFPDVLQALIAGSLAGGVFAFHARKLRDLVRKEETGD
jgi:hypothetical protein